MTSFDSASFQKLFFPMEGDEKSKTEGVSEIGEAPQSRKDSCNLGKRANELLFAILVIAFGALTIVKMTVEIVVTIKGTNLPPLQLAHAGFSSLHEDSFFL